MVDGGAAEEDTARAGQAWERTVPGVSLAVECPTCGPGRADPFLAEIHRDERWGFGFATFLCASCGELVATSCPSVLEQVRAAAVAVRRLRCSSPPRAPAGS